MILPILTSLIATGLGIFMVWIFIRKRQSDERTNQIAHILNEIRDIRNKVVIFSERLELDTAKNEKFREDINNINGKIQSINGEMQNINGQVTENRNMIYKMISVVENLQSIVGGSQKKYEMILRSNRNVNL